MDQSWQDKIYLSIASRSNKIIPYFKYIYLAVLIVSLGFGTYFESTVGPNFQTFYDLGRNFGQAAIVLLGVVVLPGILGRFGIEIKLTRLITVFRRQLGILVFVLAFSHFHLVRAMPKLIGLFPLLSFAVFEYFAIVALTFLFFMFLTSNNWSKKKLGKNWKRLHMTVYVVLWLLVLHTGLQRISIWSVFIFAFASLEVASLIFAFVRGKSKAQQADGSQGASKA